MKNILNGRMDMANPISPPPSMHHLYFGDSLIFKTISPTRRQTSSLRACVFGYVVAESQIGVTVNKTEEAMAKNLFFVSLLTNRYKTTVVSEAAIKLMRK